MKFNELTFPPLDGEQRVHCRQRLSYKPSSRHWIVLKNANGTYDLLDMGCLERPEELHGVSLLELAAALLECSVIKPYPEE